MAIFAATVTLVDSFDELVAQPIGLERERPCLAMADNLVFASSQLDRMIATHSAEPDRVNALASGDGIGGVLATGSLAELLGRAPQNARAAAAR